MCLSTVFCLEFMGIKIPDQINWDSGTVREDVHTYQIAL